MALTTRQCCDTALGATLAQGDVAKEQAHRACASEAHAATHRSSRLASMSRKC